MLALVVSGSKHCALRMIQINFQPVKRKNDPDLGLSCHPQMHVNTNITKIFQHFLRKYVKLGLYSAHLAPLVHCKALTCVVIAHICTVKLHFIFKLQTSFEVVNP